MEVEEETVQVPPLGVLLNTGGGTAATTAVPGRTPAQGAGFKGGGATSAAPDDVEAGTAAAVGGGGAPVIIPLVFISCM